MLKTFSNSDGWLFASLLYVQRRKLNLSHLIMVGNTLNHAIFSLEQINGGLSRLENEDYICFKKDRLFVTQKGKQFYKTHKKCFELCIPRQVRFSEIFSQIPLTKQTLTKQFFSPDEYEHAVQKHDSPRHQRSVKVISITWDEFLERYLKHREEFLLQYEGQEYHLAFHNEGKKTIAELNIGTKEKGYLNLEYPSAVDLLEKARINGKSIEQMWEQLTIQ